MVLAFIGWLITVRKVRSGTISQYLSGLRVVHLKKGFWPSNLRPDLVKAIMKGHENEELKKRAPRLHMTIPVLKLLKKLLSMSKMSLSQKRLIWAVCCIAFHGSFRIHELLSRHGLSFDPTTTLLRKDTRFLTVKIDGVDEQVLVIHLKNPKEDKLKLGVNVEPFSIGTVPCPVEA